MNGFYKLENLYLLFSPNLFEAGWTSERDGSAAVGRGGHRGLSAAGMMRREAGPYRPLPKTLGRRRLCRRYPIGVVAVQNPAVRPGGWTCKPTRPGCWTWLHDLNL